MNCWAPVNLLKNWNECLENNLLFIGILCVSLFFAILFCALYCFCCYKSIKFFKKFITILYTEDLTDISGALVKTESSYSFRALGE